MYLAALESGWQGVLGRDLWLLSGFALIFAAVLGFVAGFCSARLHSRPGQRRAQNGLVRLFETARQSLDSALEVCGLLERASGPAFLPDEADSLATRSQGLLESISRIVKRHRPPTPVIEEDEGAAKRGVQPSNLVWQQSESHPVTGLPDAAAFKSNLELLCDHVRHTEQSGGVLAVQIDKLSSLRTRFGGAGADVLLRKLAFLVCRSVRDEDLICQSASDRIMVLMPNSDSDVGSRIARAVRESVRQHHFRVEEQGAEVLVTASFGYVTCGPEDYPDFILDRAADALMKSQRMGRNQLHIHDGATSLYCAVTS